MVILVEYEGVLPWGLALGLARHHGCQCIPAFECHVTIPKRVIPSGTVPRVEETPGRFRFDVQP
jgi:hypothetical protein